jgi:hypothetical protein
MTSESRTQRAAEHRARTSITFQLQALVDAMEEDYTSEGGTDNDPAALNYFAAVSRQLTSQILGNAKIVNRWKRADGTLYVLALYSKSEVLDTAKSVAENPASKLAEAKIQMMLEDMDARLAKKMAVIPVDHD